MTPGGGKSLLPVIAAARLIAAGIVERVCWVVPRDSLRLQAEEAFADPAWRAALGHALSLRAADNAPDPSRGLAGYVTTYQGDRRRAGPAPARIPSASHAAGGRRGASPAGPRRHRPGRRVRGRQGRRGSGERLVAGDPAPAGVRHRAPAAVGHAGARGRARHPVAALSQGPEGEARARSSSTPRAGR